MHFSLSGDKCVPVQDTVTMQPAFILDMKGSVSVHTVEVLARSDNSCKFMTLTNVGMRFHLLSMNFLRSYQENRQMYFHFS